MKKVLAIDFGKKRIGLAISEGTLALPLDALENNEQSISEIIEYCNLRNVELVVVGLPASLKGHATQSTDSAVSFAKSLALQTQLPIRMVDERLTTRAAASTLRSAGHNAKSSKPLIDSQSAVEILNLALSQIMLGRQPGKSLEDAND